ncbi:MAG: hypothetical protein JXM70_16840, partial [Pirellulales bacterium]|nr:hypothetical protein [Pirellulales bacterium]
MRHYLLHSVLFVLIFAVAALTETPSSRPTTQPITSQPVRKFNIKISRETTYITDASLNPDGTVNYLEYLNRKYSKDITKDNNAAVLIIQAIGPAKLKNTFARKSLEELGVDFSGGKAPVFEDYDDYVHRKRADDKRLTNVDEEQTDEWYKKSQKTPWTKKQYPIVAEWLDANRAPLDRVVQASRQSKWFLPTKDQVDPESMQLMGLRDRNVAYRSRFLAKALTIRAMLYLGEGNLEVAWKEALAIKRLGTLLSRTPFLFDNMIGNSICVLGNNAVDQILQSGKLNVTQARRFLKEWIAMPPIRSIRDTLNEEARFYDLGTVMGFARSGKIYDLNQEWDIPCSMLDWNAMLEEVNLWHDRLYAILQDTNFKKRAQLFAAFGSQMQQEGQKTKQYRPPHVLTEQVLKQIVNKITFSRNVMAYLLSRTMPVFNYPIHLYDVSVTYDQLVRIGLALKVYQLETG